MQRGTGRKTRLCTHFEAGRCRRPNCNYAHGEAELRSAGGKGTGKSSRALPALAQAASAPQDQAAGLAAPRRSSEARGSLPRASAGRRGSRLCRFYQQGHCYKGDACPLSHEDTGDAHPEAGGNAEETQRFSRKRRLCRFFQDRGTCRDGSSCTYAHGEEELDMQGRQQAAGSLEGQHEKRKKRRLCKFFEAQGTCRDGSSCAYAHNKDELEAPGNQDGQPQQRKKRRLCTFFESRGTCRDGSSCAYAHGKGELEAVTSLADATCEPHIPNLRDTTAKMVTGWLQKLTEAEDPDAKADTLRSSRDVLVSALQGFTLSNFESLVQALSSISKDALRQDVVESVLKGLAGALVQPLAQKYLPEIHAGAQLDTLLEVLISLLGADPDSGIILEAPRVQAALEAAVQRCASQRSPELVRLLKEADTQGRDVVRRVVQGQERRAAAALAANVGKPGDEPLLPNTTDLLKWPRDLPKNRRAPWQHAEELDLYTYTHYQLCKEELLAPLREAITAFFVEQGLKLPSDARVPKEQPHYLAYTDVEVRDFAVSATGEPTIRLRFGLGNRRVDFSAGDHLIYGSLVVLFCLDDRGKLEADSGIYATVEEFDSDMAENCTVAVSLLDGEDWGRFNILQRFAMVESPGYFHATRPVLEWLRTPGSVGKNPLVADILSGERSRTPAYMRGAQVDISCLYKRDLEKREAWKARNLVDQWPDPHDIELDGSQQEALRHIVTSTVPLVQGPPGTGKSYIGVKAVQFIRQALDNHDFDEPIVLICLTNHALDQFLEDLLDIFPQRLARCGGRSKSEDPRLAECNVSKYVRYSKKEWKERRDLEEQLHKEVAALNHHRWMLCSKEWQALLLLAAMPFDALMDIIEAVGADLLEAGLFFAPTAATRKSKEGAEDEPRPLDFVSHIFIEFVAGTDLEFLRAKLRDSLSVARRIASLRSRGDGGRQAGVLSQFDRYVGAKPDVTGLQIISPPAPPADTGVYREIIGDEDFYEGGSPLDDRADDGGDNIRQHWLHANVEPDDAGSGPSALDQAVQARIECFLRCSQARYNMSLREEWQRVRKNLRREVLQAVRSRLRSELLGDIPWEALPHLNLSWRGPKAERTEALREVVRHASKAASMAFRQGFETARYLAYRLGQMRKKAQLRVCENAQVVGMTSNFAALNRDLLNRMSPRVVIVEEAGELLECQLMACLSSSNLQHVVLIGDHKQLRPKVNTYELCRHQHYDVSLFERLVVQGGKHSQLTTQLRMQPEVCDLVRFFYRAIDDHARVRAYPPVPGVAKSVFWISHEESESSGDGQTVSRSKTNLHEALFACRLARHLVFNGLDKAKITLLTPYIGQKRLFKQHLHPELQSTGGGEGKGKGKGKGKANGKGKGKGKGKGEAEGEDRGDVTESRGVRIVTIDDYQGEENDVVILSLVRCNAQNKLGFCGIENRIIVALSRARHGLYILGDSKMFRNSDHWYKVLAKLAEKEQVGAALPLKCLQHPDDEWVVSKPEEFDTLAKHGGCQRPCGFLLPACGHCCQFRCHPFDREHRDIPCTKWCERPRPAGCTHKCSRMCRDCRASAPEDACPTPCKEEVTATLPCGHSQVVSCFQAQTEQRLAEVKCKTHVMVNLPCGHRLEATCAAAKLPGLLDCLHEETVTGPCGHEVTKLCTELQPCRHPCQRKFEVCAHPVEHSCKLVCGVVHDHKTCGRPCKELLVCGHKCSMLCGEPHTELCEEPCARICSHGFTCSRRCWEECIGCREHCSWACPHGSCSKLCFELCDKQPCNEPCAKELQCGHLCKGKCGEPCHKCIECFDPDGQCPISLESFSSLDCLYQLDCGHIFDCEQLDRYMNMQQQSGEHVAIQAKCCPTCKKQVHTSPRYGSVVKEQLKLLDAVKRRQTRYHEFTAEERQQVDLAMGGGSSARGHWFACPNGHPYYIGECGGAMQESECPECHERVGGRSHTLLQDNSRISDFAGAGAVPPAGPGMNAH